MSCHLSAICLELAGLLTDRQWLLTVAESCTGGMIASACTDLPGASNWFERGFVTYSNESKAEMLAVSATTIARQGAVSETVARAMAKGALDHSDAQVSIAVTGIAGPDGGCEAKPVGTVWFAWGTPQGVHSEQMHFAGDRNAVRNAASLHALAVLRDLLKDNVLKVHPA